jgi:hypothetical protein
VGYKTYKRYGTTIHTYEFNPKEERFAYEYGKDMKLETIDKLPKPRTDEQTVCVVNWNFFDWQKSFNGYGEIEQDGIQKQKPSVAFPSFSFKDNIITYGDLPNAQIGAGVGQVLILDGKKNHINIAKVSTNKDARTAFCQLYNGNIVIACCEGDDIKKKGMSVNEFTEFFLSLNARIAFMGDCGGSTNMMINGKFVLKQFRGIACGLCVYKNKSIQQNKYTITATVLNIRSSPSLLGKIIGKYMYGSTIEALEIKGDWIKTIDGWCSAKYLKKKYQN